jgi:glycopeptide antibiotics resistance protein
MVAGFVHISCYLFVRVKKHSIYLSTELLLILLISYLAFIAEVTLLGRTFGSQARVFDTKWLWIDESMIQNITNLLNIILFIPFGVFITGIQMNIKSMRRIFMVINYSFLTSFLIECTQYITRTGYFELDDIEANIVGGLIGSIFFILCYRISRLISRR